MIASFKICLPSELIPYALEIVHVLPDHHPLEDTGIAH